MRRGAPVVRAVAAVAVIGLAGALGFGLWHVVVGGVVNGSAGALRFGIGLAALSAAGLWLVRRWSGASRVPGRAEVGSASDL